MRIAKATKSELNKCPVILSRSLSNVVSMVEYEEYQPSFFLFLRSIPGGPVFLISFFAREDPGGIAYCIGERAGEEAVVIAIVAAGTGGIEAAGGEGPVGSRRGRGKMCFSLLFL